MLPGFTAALSLDQGGTHYGQRVVEVTPSLDGGGVVPALRISRLHHWQVQQSCMRAGGSYWSEGRTTATYGCIRPDGSGVVCGGLTQDQANSCDTF